MSIADLPDKEKTMARVKVECPHCKGKFTAKQMYRGKQQHSVLCPVRCAAYKRLGK